MTGTAGHSGTGEVPARASSPLGVGVIGLGRIGRVHAATLATSVAGARLVHVADAVEEVARDVGAELGVQWSLSAADVLAADDVDAVVVASPTSTHPDLVVAAARHGKHVFCEKPLAVAPDVAAAAAEAAEDAGVLLQLGLMLRFDPDFQRLGDAISGGELGDIDFFHACLRDQKPPSAGYLRQSGGLMADAAVHLLDLASWLVGPIDSVSVFGTQMRRGSNVGGVDLAVATLRFASGALGVLENARAAGYGAECRAEVVGTLGAARIERVRSGHIEWRAGGRAAVELGSDFVAPFAEAYRAELVGFVDAARGLAPCRADGAAGVLASRLSSAAAESLELGRQVSLTAAGAA
jgi:predicted dehydrogenase